MLRTIVLRGPVPALSASGDLLGKTRQEVLALARNGLGWEDVCVRLSIRGAVARQIVRGLVLGLGTAGLDPQRDALREASSRGQTLA